MKRVKYFFKYEISVFNCSGARASCKKGFDGAVAKRVRETSTFTRLELPGINEVMFKVTTKEAKEACHLPERINII